MHRCREYYRYCSDIIKANIRIYDLIGIETKIVSLDDLSIMQRMFFEEDKRMYRKGGTLHNTPLCPLLNAKLRNLKFWMLCSFPRLSTPSPKAILGLGADVGRYGYSGFSLRI